MKLSSILPVVAVVAVMALATVAWAQDGALRPIPAEMESATTPMPDTTPLWYGSSYNPAAAWHGYNYDSAWGMPYALVVPPTARFQKQLGWGVGGSRVNRIYYQFQRESRPGPLRRPRLPAHASLAQRHGPIRRLLCSRPVEVRGYSFFVMFT